MLDLVPRTSVGYSGVRGLMRDVPFPEQPAASRKGICAVENIVWLGHLELVCSGYRGDACWLTQHFMPVSIPRRSFTLFTRLVRLRHSCIMVRPIHHPETFQITRSPQASLHFCSECNNLLYLKAEQQRRTMAYSPRVPSYIPTAAWQ